MLRPAVGSLVTNANETADNIPPVVGRFNGDHILVPLLTREIPPVLDQLKIATTLARTANASLTIINPISVPEQTPKADGNAVTDSEDRVLLEWAFEQTDETLPHVDGDFLYARNVVKGVLQAVRSHSVDTVVVPGGVHKSTLQKGLTDQIAAHADADVVVVNGKAGFETPPSILLPVAGGPHSGLAADIATRIAADSDAWIDVLHVIDEDVPEHRRDRAEALVEDIYHRIARPETTTTRVIEAVDASEALIEQSRYYGLTILGAPTKGRLRQFVFGSTNKSVRAGAESVVLSARNNSR